MHPLGAVCIVTLFVCGLIVRRQYPFYIRPLGVVDIVVLFGCNFITLLFRVKSIKEVVKGALCVPDHLFMLDVERETVFKL